MVDKLTVDGTRVQVAAAKAYYDEDTLEDYDQALLTDMTYNVYLDQYGNVIGVELYEGALNYVFITGYDRTQQPVREDRRRGRHLPGRHHGQITVNVKDTNENIQADWQDENYAGNNPAGTIDQ